MPCTRACAEAQSRSNALESHTPADMPFDRSVQVNTVPSATCRGHRSPRPSGCAQPAEFIRLSFTPVNGDKLNAHHRMGFGVAELNATERAGTFTAKTRGPTLLGEPEDVASDAVDLTADIVVTVEGIRALTPDYEYLY